jgi:hypothetical protein
VFWPRGRPREPAKAKPEITQQRIGAFTARPLAEFRPHTEGASHEWKKWIQTYARHKHKPT